MNPWMEKAKQNAERGIEQKEGGPFGAIIIDKNGNIIGNGNNQVLKEKDPTAHAEIVAIREACKKLDTQDLSGCILYTSCEPCPMCLAAIIWANIKTIYYGCNKEDAEKIGFRDDKIYEYIKGKNNEMLQKIQIDRDECIKTFEKYQQMGGIIY